MSALYELTYLQQATIALYFTPMLFKGLVPTGYWSFHSCAASHLEEVSSAAKLRRQTYLVVIVDGGVQVCPVAHSLDLVDLGGSADDLALDGLAEAFPIAGFVTDWLTGTSYQLGTMTESKDPQYCLV